MTLRVELQQSSADMSAALYCGRGLINGAALPVTFSDLMNGLTVAAQSEGSVGQTNIQSQMLAAVSGMQQAFSNGTLTIENAFDVPGEMASIEDGPYDGLPTGIGGPNAQGMSNGQMGASVSNGQNRYTMGTSDGSFIYFSWPSTGNESS